MQPPVLKEVTPTVAAPKKNIHHLVVVEKFTETPTIPNKYNISFHIRYTM